VCVLGIFIYFIQLGPSLQKDLSPNQFLLAVSLFGIPALINAFLILVVLRAVSESLNLISVLARNLKKK
jgi:hypothetical protein